MPTSALSGTGIGHTYTGRYVLRDTSIQVEHGEWVAVVGPSGSGKSTLLSILGLLLSPNTGVVSVGRHRDVLTTRGRRRLEVARDIGWVFQTSNALPRRMVLDNVAGPLLLRGYSHRNAREHAYEVLAELEIRHLAMMQARDLSGGELQRACIARAVVAKPAVVIADEPTGQLDAATTEDVLRTFRRIAHLGAGVLVATHDPAVADRADRTLVLVDGQFTR